MALDFRILTQTPDIGARYIEGLQAAQAEQDRNMLRAMQMQQMQMQQKNMLAQEQERKAIGEQRTQQAAKLKADMDRAARNEKLLAGLSDVLEKNNYKLDRPTLGYMAKVSMQTGDDAGAKLAMAGLQALDEREALQAALGGQAAPAAPAAAPSMMRQPPVAAAPAAPTNMFAGTMADIGTTQPAPVNALAAPPQPAAAAPAAGGMSRERLQAIILNPNAPKAAVDRAKAALESMPKDSTTPDVATMRALGFPITPQGYAAYRDAQRQERLLSPEEEAQRIRIAQASRPPAPPREPAVRTTKVELADGSIGVMNLDTGEITPAKVGGQVAKGKPSAFAEKTAAQRKQLGVDLERAITELKDASKEGGLIDQSTGSGAGRLVDVGAGFFGKATPGAIAIGKLAPIADLVLKMVPRFEGPQSDKDTKSYKEAAGQLSDATLPTKIRKDAAKEIVRLMEARKGQFATQDMAIEGAGAAPATTRSGSTVSNW